MYALIKNGQVQSFPYSISQFKRENPTISLPDFPSKELLESFGIVFVVATSAAHDPVTQTLDQDGIVFNQQKNRWETKWAVRNKTQEEIDKYRADKEKNIRDLRNKKLAETDWMALSDVSISEQWVAYRQALRDLTNQEGFPDTVTWPTKPE